MRKFGVSEIKFDHDQNDQNDHILSTKSEKCSKSRLVTTSAIKHFIAKVAEFYLKSGLVLPSRTYNVVETRRQGDKEFKEFVST